MWIIFWLFDRKYTFEAGSVSNCNNEEVECFKNSPLRRSGTERLIGVRWLPSRAEDDAAWKAESHKLIGSVRDKQGNAATFNDWFLNK